MTPVSLDDLAAAPKGETSQEIRARVLRAREIQTVRFMGEPSVHCNAQMSARLLEQYARPDEEGAARLSCAMKALDLSARAYERILKVARTIADLEGAAQIQSHHIAEAIGYRNLDRGAWAERGM